MPTVNPNSRLTEPLIAVLLADVQSGAFPPFKTPYDARPILLYLADGSELNDVLTGGTPVADLSVVNLTTTAPQNIDTNTGITAFAGGGQGSATQLTGQFNDVTTVATAGDSVKLLAAANGLGQIVKNSGAADLDIFPATGDSINGLSANTAIRIPPGATMWLQAIDATTWEGNQVTFLPFTAVGGLTAHAGGGQGSAIPLLSIVNLIATCATNGDSAVLPAATPGLMRVVCNNGAAYASLYPASGETIGTLSANVAVSLPTGESIVFYCSTAGNWFSSRLSAQPQLSTGTTTTTFTAGQLSGRCGSIVTYINTNATPGTITTRTATQMAADDPYFRVGGSYILRVANGALVNSLTFTAGSSVTLSGAPGSGAGTSIITASSFHDFQVEYTSATALTMTYMGQSVY